MSDVKESLYCSFCGKSQHDVEKLIAGPRVYICNACIRDSSRKIDEALSSLKASQSVETADEGKLKNHTYCSFCGKSQRHVKKLISGPADVFICDECVKLCIGILNGESPEKTRSTLYWERSGIPNADGFDQLLYNEESGIVVARLYRNIQAHPFGMLYARGLKDVKYEVLADESNAGISFNDPVTVAGEPFLFVLALQAVKQDDKYRGYNTIGIRKIDLKSRKTVMTMFDADIKPEPAYSRIWTSSIIGHKSGNILFCSVGMDVKHGEHGSHAGYHLCEVDVENCSVKRLTHLRETFL